MPTSVDLADRDERDRVMQVLLELSQSLLGASEEDEVNSDATLMAVLRRHGHDGGTYAKSQLLGAYRELVTAGEMAPNPVLEQRLRGRPVRTVSGVAPVAILTEPYPCPGRVHLLSGSGWRAQSYLDGEPGVLRALQNDYDPYRQTRVRIESLDAIGHATDKVELLILGGTWSAYPDTYRTSFLLRCFDALNERESDTLQEALELNAIAPHRNVGLVVETRPDYITPEELLRLRQQGVTKVQIGVQSLDDRILSLNRRGHTVDDTRRAIRLLRLAGFKVVLHWMPNLYGATPESDYADFGRIFDDPASGPTR